MIITFQKQPHIKILPAFSINGKLKMRETDLNEIARIVEDLLSPYVNGDINVTITLLEKNLKIMADMALMKEALTHLVKNAMEAIPGGGKFTLSTNQLNFEIESLLDGDNSIIGACAFISLADTDVEIDEKIKEKIFEPFFTTKTNVNGRGLPIAYRIVKQHQRKINLAGQEGQGTEINVYLPLTKPEIVNMMTIPVDVSRSRIH